MVRQELNSHTSIFDIKSIQGIQAIDDYAAEHHSGGAFSVKDGVVTTLATGNSTTVPIDAATEKLGIVNTDGNANDPRANGHNFEVIFTNAAGDEVGFGNVRYGRGIFREQVDAALGVGATRARIMQGELGSDVENNRNFLFDLF